MTRTAVVLLSKSPAVDNCKTRIAQVLTYQEANRLQEALIHDILSHVLNSAHYDLWVSAPSRQSLEYFTRFTSRLLVQKGHDLGEKMQHLTEFFLAGDYQKIILIGSDMPLMTVSLLIQAIESLDQHECVLGPALDGGYYLIGLRRIIASLFSDIPWGSCTVLQNTMQALGRCAASYGLLSPHRDVDTWSDVMAYAQHPFIAGSAPQFAEWLRLRCLVS